MTEQSPDTLGPVEFLVFEFPALTSNFTGEIEKEVRRLGDAGIIRLIDVRVIVKSMDGSIESMDLSEMEDVGGRVRLEASVAGKLAEADVARLAAAMDPGNTAAVLVYENVWAAPFAAAMRRAGGRLIADGRVPRQAILEAVQAAAANAAPKP